MHLLSSFVLMILQWYGYQIYFLLIVFNLLECFIIIIIVIVLILVVKGLVK